MAGSPRSEIDLADLFQRLSAAGDDAPGQDEKVEMVRAVRAHSREASHALDGFLVDQVTRLRAGLAAALARQQQLGQVLEKLSAPPWHVAVFVERAETERGVDAVVALGGARRLVTVADGVDAASLCRGDPVLLGRELNVVVAKSPCPSAYSGETGVFDRLGADGRLVLRSRDEEVVVEAAAGLLGRPLRAGDLVRWDRSLWMAFETIERGRGAHLFLENTPTETFDAIGGLDAPIDEMLRSVRLRLEHGDIARKYGVRPNGSVLLVGPPGNGKTLLARALANWMASASRSGKARFMNVKPAGLHSMWYSQSEANYREAFRVAREAGEGEPDVPVVMFFDEVDTIGAARGESLQRVDDRVLTAFMTELDGLESRGNILVVAATNRQDALDPALLRAGRLGDLVLAIPRPNRAAARSILAMHLGAGIPCAAGDRGEPEETGPRLPASRPEGNEVEGDHAARREEWIEATVSRIYAPNGLGTLATLVMRDGTRRAVTPRDLVSGAVLAKIARAAAERACAREVDTGEAGLRLSDLLTVVDAEFESTVRTLTPVNCRRHLEDLPQGIDVVRVDTPRRPTRRADRYLRVA